MDRVLGLLVWLAANRNQFGSDVASQSYFRAFRRTLSMTNELSPPTRQSVCEARAKLDWQALRALLWEANLESSDLPASMRFHGHVTRAIDGTTFTVPRTPELLDAFSQRFISGTKKTQLTHYPYGQLVTALNVYTLQPVVATVADYVASERGALLAMLRHFRPGDLSLLDRGLGGMPVYREHQRRGLYFVHRATAVGPCTQRDVAAFVVSRARERVLEMHVRSAETGEVDSMKVRLIRGPSDSEGKPIVFVTNLLDPREYSRASILKLYRRRWAVETFYGRIKRLLQVERFRSKSYNGVMQEIFAHLLVLSLTALTSVAAADSAGLPPGKIAPSFTNAVQAVRDYLSGLVEGTRRRRERSARELLDAVAAVTLRRQPGRSCPRVSKQPIQSWNLKKSKKLAAFGQTTSGLT